MLDGDCFRGHLAPASLKPFNSPTHESQYDLFPGPSCPGLIEAYDSDGDLVAVGRAVSGAILPRPH